jgi:two-component system sensor histidine kinase UhpB
LYLHHVGEDSGDDLDAAAAAEVIVLVDGVVLMTTVNAVPVRAALQPLDRRTVFMQRVDLLRRGERLPVTGSG